MLQTNPSGSECLSVKTAKGLESIPFQDILFLKADERNTLLFLSNQAQPLKAYDSFGGLKKRLPMSMFFHCHRSYIINMKHRRVLGKKRKVYFSDTLEVSISKECIGEYLQRSGKSDHPEN